MNTLTLYGATGDETMNGRFEEITGSLVTIGDEILLGDIPNGNAHHIALELRSRGFKLERMITVGDREEEIIPILLQCLENSHFIIATGGLGPTDDDRTCEAVSKAFHLPLIPDETYTQWLKQRVAERGREWTHELARMALLPRGAVKLRLDMAGFSLKVRDVPCYFLPGVPYEMRKLLQQLVIPDLEACFPNRLVYLKHFLRIQGIPESVINGKLKDLDVPDACFQIGYLPQVGENWVTVLVAAATETEAQLQIKKVEEQIIFRLGPEHISGHNEESLERVIGRQLLQRGWRPALAESCTGGLLSRKITAIAGSSDYFDRGFVTYSNQAKMDLLKVPGALLEAHGAVSEPVAAAMAQGARTQAKVEVAVGITGIAGPSGGSPEKPVGTVFIGCATPRGSVVEKYLFSGERTHIQESAAQAALVLLWRTLSHDPNVHRH